MKTNNSLAGIEAADFGTATLVTVGTSAAAAFFPGDAPIPCANCGAPLRHVFVTSSGHCLGGDCLATLTGDDATRAAIVRVAKKNARSGIKRVRVYLGAVLGDAADGRTVGLMSRPSYMETAGATLHPTHHAKAERFAAAIANTLGASLN